MSPSDLRGHNDAYAGFDEDARRLWTMAAEAVERGEADRIPDSAVTELLRALRLGPMEFGLWSRRRPEDYHLSEAAPAAAEKEA